jgi:DNA helicase-2/ATP-dependent DNA helicase PcrA
VLAEEIQAVGREYEQKKKAGNAMDFDDLLYNAAVLLNQPDVRQKYAGQFQYILVDEYQDTNKLQASLINRLASIHHNVLVVGDDAQSIYSFRGADINNILEFEQDYPEAKVFKLETNYRSVAPILELANNVIANNTKQYQKKLKTVKYEGERPELRPQVDNRCI